jgi:hypothetical protein
MSRNVQKSVKPLIFEYKNYNVPEAPASGYKLFYEGV